MNAAPRPLFTLSLPAEAHFFDLAQHEEGARNFEVIFAHKLPPMNAVGLTHFVATASELIRLCSGLAGLYLVGMILWAAVQYTGGR